MEGKYLKKEAHIHNAKGFFWRDEERKRMIMLVLLFKAFMTLLKLPL